MSVRLLVYPVHSSSMATLISCSALFRTLMDWSLTLSMPAFRKRMRYFLSTIFSVVSCARMPRTWVRQKELLS